jgi:hypothetical protein
MRAIRNLLNRKSATVAATLPTPKAKHATNAVAYYTDRDAFLGTTTHFQTRLFGANMRDLDSLR